MCGKMTTIDLSEEELYWEVVDADEREMGTECLHEAVFDFNCSNCDEILTVTLHVWEYPEGFANIEEILVDGGELVKGCYIGNFVV